MPKPPPAPTAEERARFEDASTRCRTDDDCEDVARLYENGTGTEVDHERARAAALKACLAGNSFICSNTTFMRNHIAAPGTHLMTDARCKGDDRDSILCSELESLVDDENAASNEVKAACATLQKAGDDASPAVLGPLVDRCPGLATPRQRERAKLFRSEAEIAAAYAKATVASPRQLRRAYERLAPLDDPRAKELLAIGIRRFAKPSTPELTKKKEDVRRLDSVRLELCALDDSSAYVAAVDNRSAASVLLHVVVPFLFPPALIFLLPDATKSEQQKKADNEAARERAAEVERQLKTATGASTLVMIPTCDDTRWFAEKSAGM